MLQKCFGKSTLSRTQVFECHKAFSEGRKVVENFPHASHPFTSVNDDNIEKVKKIVLENRRVSIREVVEAFNISYASSQHIVVYVLGMMFANAADDPTFIKRIITGDETWVYKYDVKTAQQSSEWRGKNEPKPKKNTSKSVKKSKRCSSFSSITRVWFTMNSFQRVKRSVRNNIWSF